jgi:hypothetical protein
MDDFQKDLKEKWSKLSLFGGKKAKGFKGQGQKLGSADAPKVRSRNSQHAQQHASMQWRTQDSARALNGYMRRHLAPCLSHIPHVTSAMTLMTLTACR